MSNIQATNNSPSDEIDLVELVKTLWKGKVTIAVCTVFFTVCAIVYALTAQQWWTSKAIVTVGKYQDVANIRNKVTNLYSVMGAPKVNGFLNNGALLKAYISAFNAFDNKSVFIQNNIIMKNVGAKSGISEENKAGFIDFWADKISASRPDKENAPNIYKLSFEATSPELAYELLGEYSVFISDLVRDEVINEIDANITHKKQVLKVNKFLLEARAQQKLSNELEKTKYALDMAKSADVTKPLAEMNNNEMFQIQLGTEALSEKSRLLNRIKDLNIFEPEIGTISSQLELLSQVKLDKNTSLHSIRYLKNSDYPAIRDKPKRSLITALGFFLGMILGIVIVIFRKQPNK